MIPFKTTAEQSMNIASIMFEMSPSGDRKFIMKCRVMSNNSSMKNKRDRQEENKFISGFMERLQQAIYVLDHELGDGTNVPKFTQHDSHTYSVVLKPTRKKLVFKIVVE